MLGKSVSANDSLKLALNSAITDTSRLATLIELINDRTVTPEEKLHFVDQVLQQIARIKDPQWQGRAYATIALYHKKNRNFREAIDYNWLAIKNLTLAKDSIRLGATYANLGIVFKNTAQYDSALSMHLRGLEIREKIGDSSGIANSEHGIAGIYYSLERYEQSAKSLEKVIEISKKLSKKSLIASSLSDLGLIAYKTSKYKKAISFFTEAGKLYSELNDEEGSAFIENNLGLIYMALSDYTSAETAFQNSLKLKEKLGNAVGIVNSQFNLGECAMLQGKPKVAKSWLQKALKGSYEQDYKKARLAILKNMAKVESQLGNLTLAYQFQLQATELSDSILNQQMNEALADAETKYEAEKNKRLLSEKESLLNKSLLKTKDLEKSRFIITSLLVGSFFLLVVSLIIVRIRHRLRVNELEKTQIKEQHFAVLEAEENERNRLGRELHDGLGQQLAALRLKLGLLANGNNGWLAEKLEELMELTAQAAQETRNLSHQMLPNSLLRMGLASAARDFLSRLGNENLKIHFEVIGLKERLEHNIELAIYRVLQEAVSNILKHSQASSVNIQLIRHPDEISLIIEDNGRGFQKENFTGIGIKNMELRIRSVGGSFSIDSQPDHGATIDIHIPIA